MIITPGPAVLSLAGTGAGFGWRQGVFYLLGLFIGTNTVMIFVITGLKGILFEVPFVEPAFLTISICSFKIEKSADNNDGEIILFMCILIFVLLD